MKVTTHNHYNGHPFFPNPHHHRICMVKSLGYPNLHVRFDNGREVILNVEKLIEYKPEGFSPLKTVPGLFHEFKLDFGCIVWDFFDYEVNRGKSIRLEFADGQNVTCCMDSLIKYRPDSKYRSKSYYNLLWDYPFDELLECDLSEYHYPKNEVEWCEMDGLTQLDISDNLAYQMGTEIKPSKTKLLNKRRVVRRRQHHELQNH